MLTIGQWITSPTDRYKVLEPVGEGGFGLTYLAHSTLHDRAFVLKLLKIERVNDWKALELFEREATVMRTLEHSGIPAYVEFFATSGEEAIALEDLSSIQDASATIVLVQEFVDGKDLAVRMRAGEHMTAYLIESIARQLLEILGYLHALNPPIVHRDVSPKNIILDQNERVSLVDFGAIQHTLTTNTVGGSTSVGTLGYIPIEQSMGKAKPCSDLYALGMTILVLLTGHSPDSLPLDDATSKVDLAKLGLTPAAQEDDSKRRLCALIDRVIEPIAAQRPQTTSAALALLDDAGGALVAGPNRAVELYEIHEHPSWVRTMFVMMLGGSIGSAMILYPLGFDNFSETELVNMAPFWILPAAFGLFGLIFSGEKRPIVTAIVATVVSAFGLGCFFVAIWPSL